MDHRSDTNSIWTIPNALSMFRVVLAALFAVIFWRAQTQTDYYRAVGVLALSGLTDFADGKIARHFHMVSELGKILDPIADKLTQAVVALCLCWNYPVMKLLLAVLVVKELSQGFYGLYMYRLTGRHYSSLLCGKVTTFYLYAMMILFLLTSSLPETLTSVLILLGAALLLYSFLRYIREFRKIVREAKEQ